MSEQKTIDQLDELEFVRVFTPKHIPMYLVEQVKDREYSVEDFYSFQEINCITKTKDGAVVNPLNLLYVIVNSKKIIKGFVWMVVDALTKDLIIQTFSMDKDCWYKGKAVKLLTKKVKEIVRECKLNKVYWITKHPKHSQRYGFKQSKHTLMEYTEEEDGQHSENKAGGEQPDRESAAG